MQAKLNPMRAVRQRLGISLLTVAKDLHSDIGHLSRLERCQTQASPELANRIATYLDSEELTRDMILFPDDYPNAVPARKPVQSVDAEAV